MKYNWSSLKNSFINGNYKNLKEFSEAKKIPSDEFAEDTQDGGRVGQRKHFNGEKVK